LASLFNAPAPRKKAVREKKVESDGRARCRDAGGESYKFTSPGRRSVPDQIELYGTERMRAHLFNVHGIALSEAHARAALASAMQFVEYKRPGKKPTTEQLNEHERLRARGFTVLVVDQPNPPKRKKP
jgi:hypothetical protein